MGLPPDWVSCHLYNDYEMSRKVQEKLGFVYINILTDIVVFKTDAVTFTC